MPISGVVFRKKGYNFTSQERQIIFNCAPNHCIGDKAVTVDQAVPKRNDFGVVADESPGGRILPQELGQCLTDNLEMSLYG